MAYTPISLTVPQYHNGGVPASGYYLKAYQAGSSTPIQMATDQAAGTLVNKVALNSQGYPEVSGNVIIPHLNQDFKLALYPTEAAADANSGAVWTIDNIDITVISTQIADAIENATEKTTPVDADLFGIADSVDLFGLKKLTWANIKSVLSTFAGASSTPLTAAFTVLRTYAGTAADRPVAVRFQNTGEDVGGQDYQNEVHVRLRAGTSANHRRYIGFENFNSTIQLLLGVNATGTFIVYDDDDNVHRIRLESSGDGGDTDIAAMPGSAIKLNHNSFGVETIGDTVEIWDGGLGSSNLKRYSFDPALFQGFNDSGTRTFELDPTDGTMFTTGETQSNQGFRGTSHTLNDDTAVAIALSGTSPSSCMIISSLATSGPQGMYAVRASSSPFAQLLTTNANVAVTTGVLSGTTGSDGVFTISAANNGNVYIENRLGATVSIIVTLIGQL